MEGNFISLLESSFKRHWDLDALTDYQGATLQYKDLARKIEKLHLLFEHGGVLQGDKIAICGRNSSHWAVAFLATLTYGAVAVPILHEFKAESIQQLVNHSEAKLLFLGGFLHTDIDAEAMPALEGIFEMEDFDTIVIRKEQLAKARESLNALYGRKYPAHFKQDDVHYPPCDPEELAIINYTSGTTSSPKGVMLPYRVLHSNVLFAFQVLSLTQGSKIVSMLPMAHAYGLAFEFLYEICTGTHIYFLTKVPSPHIISEAFTTIHPDIVITVPLIVEKIIKTRILPKIETPAIRVLMHLPIISDKILSAIKEQMMEGFGGNLKMTVIGGAAFNKKVENLLHSIGFPYTVGYGMTECGPIISYEDPDLFVLGSCGKAAPRMEIKIDAPDEETGIGEIICKGENVMQGYYKNAEATAQAIDKDGWLHTGDLGYLDEENNLFIKGRIKNMLLGSSGQNIYPEGIEDLMNSFPLVSECVVVQRESKLVALVVPDREQTTKDGIDEQTLLATIEDYRKQANAALASYEQINAVELYAGEFEKTPKRSIKRYLYG